ncbi:hypothetical protein QZH41_001766 [Actinostola sp. cb2023]|nr:hypothetical protein QZH41_001766 [Actinostola sp. cb2023]
MSSSRPVSLMGNGNKGKEYEPGSLQTYRNGLRRYFLDRPCPPAVDNFDLEKSSMLEFEEVAKILSAKKKHLKKNGLGNKPNAALPVEEEELEKMWSSGAIGLHNPRALLHLVWWINMTHLGMRAVQEQHDCQILDFAITDQYVEYTERQTKNRQGDDGAARKRARTEIQQQKYGGRTAEKEILTERLWSTHAVIVHKEKMYHQTSSWPQ